jgi:hypothetical protein
MPNVKVKTIGNREISCNYEIDDSVKTLKENIFHKEGIPVEQFKLIYAGQSMDENKKLTDYKVEPGHTLIMVSFLRGG